MVWIKRGILDGFNTSRQGLQELDYKGNAFGTTVVLTDLPTAAANFFV